MVSVTHAAVGTAPITPVDVSQVFVIPEASRGDMGEDAKFSFSQMSRDFAEDVVVDLGLVSSVSASLVCVLLSAALNHAVDCFFEMLPWNFPYADARLVKLAQCKIGSHANITFLQVLQKPSYGAMA